MSECVFCKIARKEISSHSVYETDNVLVFMDVNPLNEGHMLIIPKEHYETIFDMSEVLYCEVSSIVWKLSRTIKNEIKPDGLCIIQSNYKAADQIIPHFHMHLVPRVEKDYLHISRWKLFPGDPAHIAQVARQIRAAIP